MIETNFKNTEIGRIPQEWEVKQLGEIGLFSKGSGISRADSTTGNIPAVRYGELYTIHDNIIKGFGSYISNKVALSAKKLIKGDVVFTCSGETKEDIGKSAAFVDDCVAYAGGDLIILSPNAGYSSEYLGYCTNSKCCKEQKSSRGQGDAVVHISAKEISTILLPLPPLSEQTRIATALSNVDALISELGRLIEKKRAIKQGAMQQLLTGKKRLNGFNEPWAEKKLGEVGKFVSGNGFPLQYQGEQQGELPFYKVSDFNNNNDDRYLHEANNYISHDTSNILHCNIIPKNSIVFAKIGAAIFLERKRLTSEQCCIDNNMMSFQFSDMYDGDFLLYILKTINLGDLVNATALPALKTKDLQKLEILLPLSLDEQRAVSHILSVMDDEITALEAKKAKYEQIKQGMMQQLLTGRIRLV